MWAAVHLNKDEDQPQRVLHGKILARFDNSFLSRKTLKNKGGGKTSIQYNAEPQTAELQLRTVIAVNQFSIHGAVTTWCNIRSPPQTAEPQEEEGAARDAPPQLITPNSGNLSTGRPAA